MQISSAETQALETLGQFIARLRTDAAYRAELKANPRQTLAIAGVPVPEGAEIRLHESTPLKLYLPLAPLNPAAKPAANAETETAPAGMDEAQFKRLQSMAALMDKANSDEGFRQTLLTSPRNMFHAHGIALPASVDVVVLENTDKVFNLVLPPLEAEGEISDEQLEGVAGGLILEMIIIGSVFGLLASSVALAGLVALGGAWAVGGAVALAWFHTNGFKPK